MLLSSGDEILVADFASGENDRVPAFIHKVLPDLIDAGVIQNMPAKMEWLRRIVTYSTDSHGLRLDSLLGLLEEQDIHMVSRVVQAKFETMDSEVGFRKPQLDILEECDDQPTWLDSFLLQKRRFPSNCFDLGFLNNDVVGYLYEYYKAHTDAELSLGKLRNLMKSKSLLVVTQPCLLYQVNNIEVLEQCGFSFLSGTDINLANMVSRNIDRRTHNKDLSRRGHYTFLIFER